MVNLWTFSFWWSIDKAFICAARLAKKRDLLLIFISMNYRYILFAFCSFLITLSESFSQSLPIPVARTIAFTTHEGSYMNIDLSPDGKTLLFDLLGDIYTLPVAGGAATQLTHGLGLHVRPIWSPDGSRIAFVGDESGSPNLTVMNRSGGKSAVITHGYAEGWYYQDTAFCREPIWCADGRSIVFGSQTYSLNGQVLASPFPFSRLLRCKGSFAFGLDSNRLCRYDLTTKRLIFLTAPLPSFRAGMPSADSHWWCYIADSGGKTALFARDLRSGAIRLLVPSLYLLDPSFPSGTALPHFSFSPDSKALFIGYGGHLHQIELTSGDDHIVSFSADVRVDLGVRNYHTLRVNYDSLHVRYTRSASASPDGKRLVFSALDQLYVMDLPNGIPHLVSPQPCGQFQPAWSPDGGYIAYTSWSDTAGGFLWVVPSAGGQPRRLTVVPGQYQRPVWRPDGRSIAVLHAAPKLSKVDDPGIARLELVALDSSAVQLLDDSLPLWNNLDFSADGRTVNYTAKFKFDSVHVAQFIARDVVNGKTRTIAFGADLTTYAQKALSPDGRYLVYSADEDLYLVPMSSPDSPIDLSATTNVIPPGIRFAAGVDPYWENGGKTLSWSYGNNFFRINPDKVLEAAKKLLPSFLNTPQTSPVTVSVIADQQVPLCVTAPSAYGHGTLAFRHVRVITMKGDQVLEQATILVRDGRIAAIGPVDSVSIPAGTTVLDLPGTTILPGFVDLHLHMYQIGPDIFPQQCWQFLASFAYGVTTARDPAKSFDSFGYVELLRTGRMIGPRLFTVGRPVRFPDGVLRFDNPHDATAVVNKRTTLGASEIKQYFLPNRIQRQWLLQACEKAGANMTNEGGSDPLLQLAMVKDGTTGIEHNPVWGDAYDDILTVFAKSGSYLTPTLQVSYTSRPAKSYFKYKFWRYPDAKWLRFIYPNFSNVPLPEGTTLGRQQGWPAALGVDSLRPRFLAPTTVDARLRHLGGAVVMGSHGDDQGIGPHDELWALQAGGLSNLEALQEATIEGARALGIQQDLGSLEPGKIGDLLVLNANPLEDIHNSRDIRFVMKDGILYDANTLDTRWPEIHPCPEWLLHSSNKYSSKP